MKIGFQETMPLDLSSIFKYRLYTTIYMENTIKQNMNHTGHRCHTLADEKK